MVFMHDTMLYQIHMQLYIDLLMHDSFFDCLQNVDILQNNQDNTELAGDEDLDESEDSKDDDSDDDNSTSKWNSMASRNIRALVIYIFNEKTGIMETATQLVNTINAKNFGKNVEKAKQILDGEVTCNIL